MIGGIKREIRSADRRACPNRQQGRIGRIDAQPKNVRRGIAGHAQQRAIAAACRARFAENEILARAGQRPTSLLDLRVGIKRQVIVGNEDDVGTGEGISGSGIIDRQAAGCDRDRCSGFRILPPVTADEQAVGPEAAQP